MRSLSDQFLSLLPPLIALVLLALFAAPAEFGHLPFAPNVAWVMTLIVVFLYPPAWPRGFAFALGLLQDVIFATPLGSQALLTLLLAQLVSFQARRHSYQRFRVRWLEAAGVLVFWHLLLWIVYHFVSTDAPPLRDLLRQGLVSAVWYPLFYAPMWRLSLMSK